MIRGRQATQQARQSGTRDGCGVQCSGRVARATVKSGSGATAELVGHAVGIKTRHRPRADTDDEK